MARHETFTMNIVLGQKLLEFFLSKGRFQELYACKMYSSPKYFIFFL